MPGRTHNSTQYRYGFNGKEKDQNGEWGSQTHYDYGFRIYNPAIGKFLSVDPLTASYPWYTPYQFAGNKPIKFIDLDGLEEAPDKESYTWYEYLIIKYIETTAVIGSKQTGIPNDSQDAIAHNMGFGQQELLLAATDFVSLLPGQEFLPSKSRSTSKSRSATVKQSAKNLDVVASRHNVPGAEIRRKATSIKHAPTAGKSPMNPKGLNDNCFECFLHGDRLLIGKILRVSLGKLRPPGSIRRLNARLRVKFGMGAPQAKKVDGGLAEIQQILLEGGDGARGGVIFKIDGESHIVNAINKDGKVKLLDFQKTAKTLDDALLTSKEQSALIGKSSEIHFIDMTKVEY